jgi:hypothetical protein
MSADNHTSVDIPMTDEQKFVFDLKGWILIPGVLSDDETATIRNHVIALKKEEPDNLYPARRWEMPSQMLLDHPVVVGVLRTIISGDRSDECYGFRCESSVPSVRSARRWRYRRSRLQLSERQHLQRTHPRRLRAQSG